MDDFDARVQYYVSCAISQAGARGPAKHRFFTSNIVNHRIANDEDRRERIAIRAARFTLCRKGKERAELVAEARREFCAVRTAHAPPRALCAHSYHFSCDPELNDI